MGHKKRNSASRPKPSQPTSPAAADCTTTIANSPDFGAVNLENSLNLVVRHAVETTDLVCYRNVNASPSPIKVECERALTALRRGNHTKALRLMKDLCSKHDNSPHSALVYRVQGTVCVKVSGIIDDPTAKQRHLRNAIDSARKAVTLSPNSVEFSHFYANLLYEASNEAKDFEEVVQECERALAIENPVDPGKESLQDEKEQKLSTPEARVDNVQNEIRSLIQKSNIASISSWMKNLGTDEKFRLIPLRRVAEDPMELRLVQARRPNEIKKATKTPEERRKEIEVRVAAARLLQQKSESTDIGNDMEGSNNNYKGLDCGAGSGQRVGERRRSGNVRKTASSSERRDCVRSYWESMSSDRKKDLLRIRILDLKSHFSTSKDGLPTDVLNEALCFGEANKLWKFWMCCRCNEKFTNAGSFMNHVVHEHMGSLLPKWQSILPQNLETEWAEMILNCEWKPLDLDAAIRVLEKHSKPESPEFLDDSYSRHDADDSKECFLDSYSSEYGWDSSPGPNKLGNSCNSSNQDRDFEDVEWMDCDADHISKENLLHEKWPLSDDPERVNLLERIRSMFQVLINHKCLAMSHLNKVIHFAVDELQGLVCGSQVLNSNLDQTPLCICFLNALELKKILKYLQDVAQSCGLSRYSDKSTATDDSKSVVKVVGIPQMIIFGQDAQHLVLDEHFLPCKMNRLHCNGFADGDSSRAVSPHISYENGVVVDSDALLSWIFTGPSSIEQLASWSRMREDKAHQGLEILQLLEKESYNLQSLCERKSEHLSYEEALQGVEDLCLEEGKKREHISDFARQSYETVLRRRREELVDTENEINIVSHNKFELEAVNNVIKDAESIHNNQYSFEETYGGVTTHLYDLESGEDDWRTKDYLHQLDSYVEHAIQRQKEAVSIEISKIDARMMRTVTGMQQLELNLESASSFDFQTILIPLLKSLLRACLEDLAEKDATEKSDAAREAFLAELALDSKKGAGPGIDRTKDKKKIKEHKKSKDPKVIYGYESNDQATVDLCLPSAHDEESQGSETDVPGSLGDALRLQEQEYKRRIELEAEERKLEETLEYQRRIENEAKQKHLAEQHKRNSRTVGEKAEMVSDVYLRPVYDDKDAAEVCTNRKDGSDYIGEGVGENIADGAIERPVFPNGIPQDGGLFSDRRSGRRGRRHKGPTKLIDGKYQLTSETEESNAGHPMLQHNLPVDGENGAKTLRQLKAEDDDEERFQADLQKAVRQSLDAFNARHKSLAPSSSARLRKEPLERSGSYISCNGDSTDVNEKDTYGTGLKNDIGEYNCFLNVIIQSLWHLRRFRDEFLQRSSSEHIHVGDPCVVCALYGIFTALSTSSTDNRRGAIAPTSLRVALSNLYPDSNFFQEGQMNDASEVLSVIFNCLHRSFTPAPVASFPHPVANNCTGSWDCTNTSCIAHSIFGMDIFERMNCGNCGLESRYLKYTSFFHNINASALRTMKVMYPGDSLDKLLNNVEMNHQLACDPEAGGCGKLNYIHHILSTPPHVFTTVLGWQNTCESVEDITATLAALNTDIDMSVLYRGLDPQNRHHLVSMVCYYGQHYHCFAYSRDHKQWIMYDDKTVKVIGGWNDVVRMCERGHLQPQVLLFEDDVN